ncbi:hypothetical protein AAD046_19320 [Providencia rettgeri]
MAFLEEANCIDDLLNGVHKAIMSGGIENSPTKGKNLEILGACLILTDPTKR